jgi:Family of unknown function (DUF6585)
MVVRRTGWPCQLIYPMAFDPNAPITPDWPNELIGPVERLGPPREVFHFPRHHASRRILLGVILIVINLIGNFVYFFVFNGPFIPQFFLLLLFFGPMATGLGLIYAAVRDRGLWVLIYPSGILRWQRGEVVTFPWDEIVEVLFHRVVECDRPKRKLGPNGEWLSVWLPILKMRSRSLGAYLSLRREDGSEAILPTSLENFHELLRIVQHETFRVLWPKMIYRQAQGRKVHFGLISVGSAGIFFRDERLPWRDFDDVLIANGKLVVRVFGMVKPWIEIPLQFVMNPHLLIALTAFTFDEARAQARAERYERERAGRERRRPD